LRSEGRAGAVDVRRGLIVDGALCRTDGVDGQQWTLDMLSNWDEVWTDSDGNGSYAAGEKQDRDHNQANEIEDIIGISAPFAYDDAGNMESSGTSTSFFTNYFTHDAWNRLTQMKIGTTVQGEYEYNALHWRNVKRARTDVASTGPDEERLMFYNASWQLIQEDVDNDFDTDPDINERMQTFWGARYVDDAVYRPIDRGSGSPRRRTYSYSSTSIWWSVGTNHRRDCGNRVHP